MPGAIRPTVTLVAVSKTVPPTHCATRSPPGSTCSARTASRRRPPRRRTVPGARWHLVGPLQSNKARRALEVFDVDPVGRLGRARASGSTGSSPEVRPGRPLPGPAPGQRRRRPGQGRLRAGRRSRRALAERARRCRTSTVRGLMTIGRLASTRRGRPTDVPRPARAVGAAARRAGRAARPGAVDGHDRRLRGRGRGGRDDRPRRPRAVRGARPRPCPPASTADRFGSAGRLGRGFVHFVQFLLIALWAWSSGGCSCPGSTRWRTSCRFLIQTTEPMLARSAGCSRRPA